MENAVDAIKMAFGMIVFVMAMTATMYLFTLASSTSQVLLYAADETNYFDNVKINGETDGNSINTRTVSVETIIPTLYRYYKENFAVQIYNKDNKLVQIFDVNIEGKVRKAASTVSSKRTGEQKALMSLYGVTLTGNASNDSINPYLFEAPWIGNTSKDIKTRIDLYVNGECGYINNTKVDYRNNNLLKCFDKETRFTEEFTQYAYKGDTIASEDGTETITGNVKAETKIVIIYREQNKQ